MNRKKKLPVVHAGEREEAELVAALPVEAAIPLADVAGAIREGLMAFCCSAGLLAVTQIMNEELTAKAGPKGKPDSDRVATRNGTALGSVVLGSRSVPVRRPRATLTGGGDSALTPTPCSPRGIRSPRQRWSGCWPGWPPAATLRWPSRSEPSLTLVPEATPSRRCPADSRLPPRRRWPS